MQSFFRFMIKTSRHLGSIAFRHSILKQVLLIFMTVSLARAVQWDNQATITTVCDNSTMHLNVNFSKLFKGTIYQARGYFNSKCSYTVPINENVTKVDLSMPFGSCDIQFEELDHKTIASTEVVIQMHSLLDSIYDKLVNVYCEIYNFQEVNETDSVHWTTFEPQVLDHSWIEFKNGLVLFGEVGEPIESTLYLVVYVRDHGLNQDMVVQNCFAHTDKNVSNTTKLVRLSNFYGCPDPSAILPNFTVVHRENYRATMFAYAPIANFSLLASRGRMSISCGVTICKNACPLHCNDTYSPVRLPLSDYTTKDIVTRNDGAVMPDSLRDLNRHNDRFRRSVNRPKRSVSFFASIFQWESRIVNGSVTEENVTNITSVGMAKGLVIKRLFAKNVLVPTGKPVGVLLKTRSSDLLKEEYIIDGETFRFIALMTICLFITIVACYCCYFEKNDKTTRS